VAISQSNFILSAIMTYDPSSLDAALNELRATPLEADLLQRLEAAADGTLTQPSREEICFEETLRRIAPAGLTADFMARLQAVTHEVPFPVNEKIVLFPKASHSPPAQRKNPRWAAAAAVALIGGMTALMIPSGSFSKTLAQQKQDKSSQTNNLISAKNFVPTAFNRGISEVHHEGIVWSSDNHPHNVVKIVYKDLVTLEDENGRTIQVEQPLIKYLSVPAKTD
jgi:hypothetical protein